MEEYPEIFEQHRPTLIGLAYRMLGTVTEAQDVVQDCYLKWMQADQETIRNPRSWLLAVCSRLTLDILKSARVQRETYYGVWLPEPFVDDRVVSPETTAEIDETVAVALLLALEQLSPEERTTFLLSEVFDYSFDEIAAILNKSPAACRQLGTRARTRIHKAKPRFHATAEEHRRLTDAFLQAARSGDLSRLTALLASSVELHADGGGKAQAVPAVLQGANTVATFFVRIWDADPNNAETTTFVPRWFNGAPGLLIYEAGRLVTALTLAVAEGAIHRIYAIRNPDKLASIDSDRTHARPPDTP
ncbi:MAG: RNA polymerase sigma factor SigJ [Nitrospiraceae bacterium]